MDYLYKNMKKKHLITYKRGSESFGLPDRVKRKTDNHPSNADTRLVNSMHQAIALYVMDVDNYAVVIMIIIFILLITQI